LAIAALSGTLALAFEAELGLIALAHGNLTGGNRGNREGKKIHLPRCLVQRD
jgi:hypothetical protein